MFDQFNESIYFVTPDLTRAIGLEKLLPNYHIICLQDNDLVDILLKHKIKVFCLERELGKKNVLFRNTGKILEHLLVEQYIKKTSKGIPHILYFKPSKKIDEICAQKGYVQLGNKENLNFKFEDKINFYKLCESLNLPSISSEIISLKEAEYRNLIAKFGGKFVIQFERGWAGNSTYFIDNEEEFNKLKKRFSKKIVKVSSFIESTTVIVNACVRNSDVLISPIGGQITAPEGFTNTKGGTCGRYWPFTVKKEQKDQIINYTKIIGQKMREDGYKGSFGLDFLIEKNTNKIFIGENNARLTASIPFYTKLELKADKSPILLHHIAQFIGKENLVVNSEENEDIEGTELMIRNSQTDSVKINGSFKSGIYKFENEELIWIKEAYSIEDISTKNEFLILCPSKDQIISPENEIARLNTFDDILDENGNVTETTKKIMFEIKEHLLLQKTYVV